MVRGALLSGETVSCKFIIVMGTAWS